MCVCVRRQQQVHAHGKCIMYRATSTIGLWVHCSRLHYRMQSHLGVADEEICWPRLLQMVPCTPEREEGDTTHTCDAHVYLRHDTTTNLLHRCVCVCVCACGLHVRILYSACSHTMCACFTRHSPLPTTPAVEKRHPVNTGTLGCADFGTRPRRAVRA